MCNIEIVNFITSDSDMKWLLHAGKKLKIKKKLKLQILQRGNKKHLKLKSTYERGSFVLSLKYLWTQHRKFFFYISDVVKFCHKIKSNISIIRSGKKEKLNIKLPEKFLFFTIKLFWIFSIHKSNAWVGKKKFE